ncbi:MAG: dihydrodipicolinate synthase family protein [Kiritimatiellae bacterium]|nr:dihydrodipicolinate synthase family protein [Kiritimatiellia bacterium]
MKTKKLEGLVAAAHTPFAKDGSVDVDQVPRQAAALLKQKVIGAYVCGTTGEGISCSVEERKAVMAAWARAAKGKLFLIAHTGALGLTDAQELGAYAEELGYDAVSVVPANYFKPGSVATLVDYLNAALEGCRNTPFYYYHTGMSGIHLDMQQFLEKADGRIPNLAGIKFNYPDLYMYQRCMRCCGGKYDITWGIDEWFAGAVACGAKSAIGSTYNYAAPIYTRIAEAVRKGDLKAAEKGMKKVCDIVDILVQYGGVAAGKTMMAVHGMDLGDVRLPCVPLTAAQKADCIARLRKIGYR